MLLSSLQDPFTIEPMHLVICVIHYRKAIDKYDGTVRCLCIVRTEIFRNYSLLSSRSFFITYRSLLFCHNLTSFNFFSVKNESVTGEVIYVVLSQRD